MSSRNKRSALYNINPEVLQQALDNSSTWQEVGDKLGLEVKASTMRRVISHFNLSIHGLKKNLTTLRKKNNNSGRFDGLSYEELRSKTSARITIKRYIIKHKLIEYKCAVEECGNTGFHLGKRLSLQLDHIDGDNSNNELSNLRFLCPNCHSQTDTFGSKNIKRIPKTVKAKSNKNRFEILKDELVALVKIKSLSAIGRQFGVSDNAIRKRCIKLGVEF